MIYAYVMDSTVGLPDQTHPSSYPTFIVMYSLVSGQQTLFILNTMQYVIYPSVLHGYWFVFENKMVKYISWIVFLCTFGSNMKINQLTAVYKQL